MDGALFSTPMALTVKSRAHQEHDQAMGQVQRCGFEAHDDE